MNNGNKLPRWSGKAVWAGVAGLIILVALVLVLASGRKQTPPSGDWTHTDASESAPPPAQETREPAKASTAAATVTVASAPVVDVGPAAPTVDKPARRKRTLPAAFDVRATREHTPGSEAQQAARTKLQRELPNVEVQFDPITSAPKHVMAVGRFIAPAMGGKPDAEAAVRSFVDRHPELFGHGSALLKDARVTRDDVTSHSGLVTRVWQQVLDGVPLYKTVLKANLTKRGELITLGSHFVADPAAASGFAEEDRQTIVAQPPVSAPEAIVRAAAGVGEQVSVDLVRAVSDPDRPERRQRFEVEGLSDVTAALTWVPMNEKTLRLGWEVTLMSTMLNQMYEVVVDAQTGEPLVRVVLTADATNASYRVYASGTSFKPFESPTPMLPGTPTPSGVQGAVVPRQLVTLQSVNATASPNGWINDGGTETLGNNVAAHTDIDANNAPDLPRPSAANRVFDFPLDLTLAPSTYREASVTHLFYICNWMHDELYTLGFTESAGNFQTNNFGRGGLGNDALLADAQDGSGTNNANMSTPGDGSPPRMQMFVFTGPNPDRDGDFDNVIVLHEYTHGLTNRLVGGGVGISALATRGMGEGWSDFYGIAMLADPASDPNATYPGGAYATYLLSGMTSNHYYGIRRYPYTTDLSRNPLTLRDIDPTQARAHIGIPLSPRYTASNDDPSQVHRVGEVWCVTLWECRARLIAKHGPTGHQRILELVTDALKLSPANPNFLQARDAVIQADLVRTGGADAPELWAAFAKRGMGASASAPASSTTTGIVEASDLPDVLQVNPQGLLSASGPVGGPFTPALQSYTLSNTGTTSLTWYAVPTQPWLVASPNAGTLAPGASMAVTVAFTADAFSRPQGTYNGAIDFRNAVSGASITRGVQLTAGSSDWFTEIFDTTTNDTDNQSWLFTPNGSPSFYSVARTSASVFPTDPAGGTALVLSDDSFVQVTPTASVALFGVAYPSFFVGSNGFVSFGSGSSSTTESLGGHFGLAQIVALWDDLDPAAGGSVSWRQLADRIAVTWQNVPEYAVSNTNSFQIEMFFDGRIRITCLGIAAVDGLIGLSRGQGTPAGFVESDFSAYGTTGGGATLMSLVLPASVTEGAGVLVGQASVTLASAQPGAVTVALSSSNASKLGVPATVIVPAGQTTAAFNLTVPENAVIDGPQPVVISATAPGLNTAARSVNVLDNEAGGALSLTIPSTTAEGAGTVAATLGLSVAPGAPLLVALASSDTTEVQVPAVVVVPAGANAVSFSATILDDFLIDGTQNATITASLAGWTPSAATIAVNDNELSQLSLSLPGSISEGATATGSVSVSGVLQTPLSVTLSSADSTRLSFPLGVTIPAGSSSVNFTLTAPNNPLKEGSVQVLITAAAGGFGTATATGTVLDNDVHDFLIEPIASSQIRGVPFGATIRARDINGLTIGSFSSTAALTVSAGSTALPVTPSVTGAFTSGVWTGNITVGAFGAGVVLRATDSLGNVGASNAFNVGTGPLHRFVWSQIPSPQGATLPFTATITAQDAGDNTVTAYTGTANVTGTTLGPAMASIIITEVFHDAPDEVEFMNVGTTPVDLSGWQVYLYDNVQSPLPVFTIPAGTICPPGGIFRLQEFGTSPGAFPQFFLGANIDWTSSPASEIGVLLRDASGNAVDFMCAAATQPGDISQPQTIPASLWTGAPVSAPTISTDAYARTGSLDSQSAVDWTTAPATLGLANAGLNVPFAMPIPVPVSPTVTGAFVNGAWTGVVRVMQGADPVRLSATNSAGVSGLSNAFVVVQTIFAQGQTVAVPFGGSTSIVLVGVDVENPTAPLSYVITTPPSNGTLSGVPPNVTYTPAAGFFGSDSFAFTVANGPRVSAPGTVSIAVAAPPAEIVVEHPPGTPLVDGAGVVSFGVVSSSGSPVSRQFTIRNSGGSPLTLSGIVADGPDASDFTFPTLAGVVIPGGGSASFTATLNTGSVGVKSAVLRIGSDDSDENPFDIALAGEVIAAPEIAVEQPAGTGLVAGLSTVSFGDAVVGVQVVRSFTVRNVGTQPLSLGTITTGAAEFAIAAPSQSVLPPGSATTFSVTFTPPSTGARAATLRIPSDDADENPFQIRLVGIGSAPAGLLRLARDINSNGAGAGTTSGIVMGGTVFFGASTPETGLELWKTDGTLAGTSLVRDINPGAAGSSPGNFRIVGSTLFFSATTVTGGVELWKTDGTTAGTVLVRDIFPGAVSSNPTNLTNVAGTLFFSASDSTTNGAELWKSDGTTAGTVMVANIHPATGLGSSLSNFVAVGSTLYFAATNGSAGVELWKSDGTAATTVMVSDLLPGSGSSSPGSLVAMNGRVFFAATTSTTGRELWTSDGTAAGTVLVRDINGGGSSSSPAALTVVGSTLYLTATTALNGTELWKSDGTAAGTVLVRDINPAGSSVTTTTVLFPGDGSVYFAASNGVLGTELWKSHGTSAGTTLVADINPGSVSSFPASFSRIGSTLYFSATGASGTELWKSDIVTGETAMVRDLAPGTSSATPSVLLNAGGRLFFVANDGVNGAEIWTSDGTTGGTSMLRDFMPGTAASSPANLRVLNDRVIYSATDGVLGTELWSSNGLPGGTTLVRDIASGSVGSSPGAGVMIGSTLYFPAFDSTGGTELWKSDGTAVGTVRVRDINPGTASSSPNNLTRVGNLLYFGATDANGTELWKSDGTEAGTVMVADIAPTGSSNPANPTEMNGVVFFTASNGTAGTELWKTDGTSTGTMMVADLNPGASSSSPGNLRVMDGFLYIVANTPATGTELWRTDGTTVTLVADVISGTASSFPSQLAVVGSTLFFSATGDGIGSELWMTTGSGATLVKDINPGSASSSPLNLMNYNGVLFLTAFNAVAGRELWRSDGTDAGTQMVRDIASGITNSNPGVLTNIAGVLYFSAFTSATGTELWKSDGTEAGTVQAADIRPGPLDASPAGMVAIGDRLFFSAAGPDLGTELWVLELNTPDISVEQPVGVPLNSGAAAVEFGSATIGAGGEQRRTFTIRNTASAGTLTGFFIRTIGAAVGDFTFDASSLVAIPPGGSANLDVVFAPTGPGRRATNLWITSNDPDEAPFAIILGGTGVAPTSIQSWRLLHFGTVANTGQAADLADFDGDGVLNFFEFGFGTDPGNPASGPGALAVTGGLGGGSIVSTGQPIAVFEPRPNSYEFRAVYIRRKDHAAAGLTYTVQFSANLETWHNSSASPTVLADDGAHQAVSVPYPYFVGGEKARFFRVQVSTNP